MIEDILKYSRAFDLPCIYAVWQFNKNFKWNSEEATRLMREVIDRIEAEREEAARQHVVQVERAKRTNGVSQEEAEEERYPEPPSPKTVIGMCPRCNSNLVGEPIGGCGKKKKRRAFYKECVACNYYAEVWKIGNKYRETEGG